MPDGTYLASQPPPHGDHRFNDAQIVEWDADPKEDVNETPQVTLIPPSPGNPDPAD